MNFWKQESSKLHHSITSNHTIGINKILKCRWRMSYINSSTPLEVLVTSGHKVIMSRIGMDKVSSISSGDMNFLSVCWW